MTVMHAVTMPKWGLEMQQGTIVTWHVQPGQRIDKGATLADVETDKILGSIEAPVAGVLLRTIVAAGSTLPVGNLIAVLGPPDAHDNDIESFVSTFGVATAPAKSQNPQAANRASIDLQHGHATGDGRTGLSATPHAGRRAAELGIDLATIAGSGRNGRISVSDVESAHARAQSTVDHSELIRERAARRLVDAVREIPHFRVSIDLDVTRADTLRREVSSDRVKVTLTHCLVRAAALSLAACPRLNATCIDGQFVSSKRVDVSLAVATSRGLYAPVIRDADRKSLVDVAAEATALVARARNGQLGPDEVKGGSFTVTSLGMYGIKSFDAIINAPQVAILALGAAIEQPAGDPVQRQCRRVISATLSCDHRVIDGVEAASWLVMLKQKVEACEDLVLAKVV
jgi:pyruvate dehydrogenase E2 component (dihydrolipoamide acetyltransferase)